MSNLFTKPVRSRSNAHQRLKKLVASLLARMSQQTAEKSMPVSKARPAPARMGLYTTGGGRKYLNATERRRFVDAAKRLPPKERLFCFVLMWSGSRISEALAITPLAIDFDSGLVSLETLKKRTRGIVRQVPLPPQVLRELDHVFELRTRQRDPGLAAQRLWSWSRSTGWRYVKQVMRAAGISGNAAMPKGLRHAFGVVAFSAVPPHLVQRWLGHASLRTTAIYGEVSGPEERLHAARVWKHW